MDTLAYCCASFATSVKRAAGVAPLLSPPVTFNTFLPDLLMGRDLIYFKLHGIAEEPYWYGDHWTTALHIDAFKNIALRGTVVFVANCFFAESPFLEAILKTGALVIGGSGENFAQPNALIGADLLGRAIRQTMQAGARPAQALRLAKLHLVGKNVLMKHTLSRIAEPARREHLQARIKANEDALAFKLYS